MMTLHELALFAVGLVIAAVIVAVYYYVTEIRPRRRGTRTVTVTLEVDTTRYVAELRRAAEAVDRLKPALDREAPER